MVLITGINTNNFDGKFKRFKSNIELKAHLVKGSYSKQSSNILEYSFNFFDDDYKATYHNKIWYPGTVSSNLPFSFTITEISKIEDKGDLSIYRMRGTFNLKMVNEENDKEIITIANGNFK